MPCMPKALGLFFDSAKQKQIENLKTDPQREFTRILCCSNTRNLSERVRENERVWLVVGEGRAGNEVLVDGRWAFRPS